MPTSLLVHGEPRGYRSWFRLNGFFHSDDNFVQCWQQPLAEKNVGVAVTLVPGRSRIQFASCDVDILDSYMMAVDSVVPQPFVDQESSCLAPFIPGSCILVQDRSSAAFGCLDSECETTFWGFENETPVLQRFKDIRHMGSGLCDIGEYASTKHI